MKEVVMKPEGMRISRHGRSRTFILTMSRRHLVQGSWMTLLSGSCNVLPFPSLPLLPAVPPPLPSSPPLSRKALVDAALDRRQRMRELGVPSRLWLFLPPLMQASAGSRVRVRCLESACGIDFFLMALGFTNGWLLLYEQTMGGSCG